MYCLKQIRLAPRVLLWPEDDDMPPDSPRGASRRSWEDVCREIELIRVPGEHHSSVSRHANLVKIGETISARCSRVPMQASSLSSTCQPMNSLPPPLAWPDAAPHPILHAGEVHVWRVSLDETPHALADALSAAERVRAARFHFERDAARFRAGRGALRAIIAGYLDCGAARF